MNIIDICVKNALKYSKEVCAVSSKESYPFPIYFDWADHIAISEANDYLFHLNKTALELENLITIFKSYIKPDHFEFWKHNWHEQVIAAAWIHDIGMIKTRKDHSVISAEFLFDKNDFGFDFKDISHEDRVKMGMLCIKHNNGWTGVYGAMRKILLQNKLPLDILDHSFEDEDSPKWALDFSGRLISTADFLRYRGKGLRNNLEKRFFIWSECVVCKTMYNIKRDFCSETNCRSPQPEPKVVVNHYFDHNGFGPEKYPEFPVYQETESGKSLKIEQKIEDTHAHVRCRDDYQIFTRGDMSLPEVRVIDCMNWLDDLRKREVDCRNIEDHIFDQEGNYNKEYKTVVLVDFDNDNFDSAMFVFSKYIATYLHHNLAIDDYAPDLIFANNVILHISASDDSGFSGLYKRMHAKEDLPPETRKAITVFNKVMKQWKEQYDIVLPVELIGNRIEVISL